MRRPQAFPKFNGHVSNEDAMFFPQFFDLSLACVQEMIEVVYEQHTFAWRIRSAPTANQDVIGILGR
jgi:hypothetical protein